MDTVFTETDTERASLVSDVFTLQFVFTTMQEVEEHKNEEVLCAC